MVRNPSGNDPEDVGQLNKRNQHFINKRKKKKLQKTGLRKYWIQTKLGEL